jgi:tRNA pseudouridine38-40 synthase
MRTWKLTLEYDGTRYSGWQEQRNARTVQGVLRTAVEEFLGERVDLGGAGRTDAGVHALAQVAHLRTGARVSPLDLQYGVNDRLPSDVNVLSVEPAARTFHARHHAVARGYLYRISTRRTAFGKRFVWWIKDSLDERAMAQAASLFVGRHDFASFCERPDASASTLVEVEASLVLREGDMLLYRVVASHFLWKMVRRLVGALAAVGRGQMRAGDVEQLLATRSRAVAALTAPPSGLFLERVYYEGYPAPGVGDRGGGPELLTPDPQ